MIGWVRVPVFKPHDKLLVASVVEYVGTEFDPRWSVAWRERSSERLPAGQVGRAVDVHRVVVSEDASVGKPRRWWHVATRRASAR